MSAFAVSLITRRGVAALFSPTLSHPFSLYRSHLRNVGCRGIIMRRHFSAPLLFVDFTTIKDMKFASFVFDAFMKIKHTPSPSMFNDLLNAVVKMEEYTAALSMFDKMRQSGKPVNVYTMNIVIHCYCLLNRVDYGFSMLGCIFKLGYEPNAVTFTTLIKGLCLDGKLIEAEKLFYKLLALNLSMTDEVTIHILINALCNGGCTTRASDLLHLLEGTTCKLIFFAYNTVIVSLCKEGIVDEALHHFHKMIDNGIAPNHAATFSPIIHGLCEVARWKDVTDLFHETVNHNIPLDVFTFTKFVNAFCKQGMVKEAERVVKIMIQRNIAPTIVTYNALLDGYCSLGHMDEAKKMFGYIVNQGLQPNIFTYGSLIKGYCKQGNVVEAWRLFLDVPQKGLIHTTCTYSTMLHGLFDAGKFSEGWKLFNHMEAQQVPPNLITCNILLDGLVKSDQIDKAASFLSSMEDRGFCPDAVTYRTLVNGLCAHGRLDAARNILNQLPSKGLQPDIQMYNVIVASLCRKGLMDEAKCLLREMEENCSTPNSVTYNLIIRVLLRRNELYKAIPFLKEMSDRGFMAESTTASMLLDQLREGKGDKILVGMIRDIVPENMLTQFSFLV